MDLFIQMGHNTRKLAMEHLEDFGSGTVILSPMNIAPNKIGGCSDEVHKKMDKFLLIRSYIIQEKFRKSCLNMHFGRRMILRHWKLGNLIR